MISAEVVCDSISEYGKRITTFRLRYPKFIHGEFMTHRVISRNASSSRAIPTAKLIEEVRSDALRAAPVFWGKNQSGMQAVEELSDEPYTTEFRLDEEIKLKSPRQYVQDFWKEAALEAATYAEMMTTHKAHKQIVNRLLEPFSHINVVATATEWDNFFGLRLHKDAQPEMQALAKAMWNAWQKSTPDECPAGKWHLPFCTLEHPEVQLYDALAVQEFAEESGQTCLEVARLVSVARCARVSYQSFETGRRSTVAEDIVLYHRLAKGLTDPSQPLHASPFEHQATPDSYYSEEDLAKVGYLPEQIYLYRSGLRTWQFPDQHGNFVGWCQYRKMLPNEAVAPLPDEYLPF